MKRTLISALALGLTLAGGTALAQSNYQGNGPAMNGPAHANRNNDRNANGPGDNDNGGPNVIDKRTTVRQGPNETVRRTVTTRPNGNVRITRKVIRAPRRFHIRAWVAPRGFTYRRFALGERVPTLLLAAPFFLTDFITYGLTPPPPGFVWVRDGSDAVLVDQSSGEVVQVEYDLFD